MYVSNLLSCSVTLTPSAFFFAHGSASGSFACIGCVVCTDDIFSGTWSLLLFIGIVNMLVITSSLYFCFTRLQNMYFSGSLYNYDTYQTTYLNVTAISNPIGPTALANAIADVLFLPHSAVSINSYTPLGYSGCGAGGYCNPSTSATLTVLYQGTGLIPSINAITYAYYEAIYAVTSQEKSPLGNALNKYGFPNAVFLNQINGQTLTSKSYTAGQPTPSPTTFTALTVNTTIVGDNVTTISHLNYPANENVKWYINPPHGVANGANVVYTIYFPQFNLGAGSDSLITIAAGSYRYCYGKSCGPYVNILSTTGLTLQFTSSSQYWTSSSVKGFIAQLTWQIVKPRKSLYPFQ